MSLADDTDDLLDVWGETVTIVRNTPTYGTTGEAVDSWASTGTASADIQPLSQGVLTTQAPGQQRESHYSIFFPNGTAILQGDRIRPSGWATGDDEYIIDMILSDEGHVECLASRVVGHG